jgi:hypothetical protein
MDAKSHLGISSLSILTAISIVLEISLYVSRNSFAQIPSENFTYTTK